MNFKNGIGNSTSTSNINRLLPPGVVNELRHLSNDVKYSLEHVQPTQTYEYSNEDFANYLTGLQSTLKRKPLKVSKWKNVTREFHLMFDSVYGKESSWKLELPVPDSRKQHQKKMLEIFEAEKTNLVFAYPDMAQFYYAILHRASLLHFRHGNLLRARDIRRKVFKIFFRQLPENISEVEYPELLRQIMQDRETLCEYVDLEFEYKMFKKVWKISKEQKTSDPEWTVLLVYVLCTAGDTALKMKAYKDALADFRQALKYVLALHKTHPFIDFSFYRNYILLQIGICHLKLKNMDLVEKTFCKCLEKLQETDYNDFRSTPKVMTDLVPGIRDLNQQFQHMTQQLMKIDLNEFLIATETELSLGHVYYENNDHELFFKSYKSAAERLIKWILTCINKNDRSNYLEAMIWMKRNRNDIEKALERLQHYFSLNPENSTISNAVLVALDLEQEKMMSYEETKTNEMICDLLEVMQLNVVLKCRGRINGVKQKWMSDFFKTSAQFYLDSGFNYKALQLYKQAYNLWGFGDVEEKVDIAERIIDMKRELPLNEEIFAFVKKVAQDWKGDNFAILCKLKMAECYLQSKNFEAALEKLPNLNSMPGFRDLQTDKLQRYHQYLGECYYGISDYESSVKYFDKALNSDFQEDGKNVSHFYKGLCLMKLKQKEKAIESLKECHGSTFIVAKLLISSLKPEEPKEKLFQRLEGHDMRHVMDMCPQEKGTQIFDLICQESKYGEASTFRNSYQIAKLFERKSLEIKLVEEQDFIEGSDEDDDISNEALNVKNDSSKAEMAKMTDFDDDEDDPKELEISQAALAVVYQQEQNEALERQKRESKMLKLSVNREDVDLIVQEMEISRERAERVLREHDGNVVNALVYLTN